jgi:tryptophan-rich sensory protein
MQLGVNFLWSILFFGLRNPLLGLLDIGVLIVLIVLLIKASYKVNKSAAYLLIPYLAWVSFATLLNLSVVILN